MREGWGRVRLGKAKQRTGSRAAQHNWYLSPTQKRNCFEPKTKHANQNTNLILYYYTLFCCETIVATKLRPFLPQSYAQFWSRNWWQILSILHAWVAQLALKTFAKGCFAGQAAQLMGNCVCAHNNTLASCKQRSLASCKERGSRILCACTVEPVWLQIVPTTIFYIHCITNEKGWRILHNFAAANCAHDVFTCVLYYKGEQLCNSKLGTLAADW